jgi:hypothetical protein
LADSLNVLEGEAEVKMSCPFNIGWGPCEQPCPISDCTYIPRVKYLTSLRQTLQKQTRLSRHHLLILGLMVGLRLVCFLLRMKESCLSPSSAIRVEAPDQSAHVGTSTFISRPTDEAADKVHDDEILRAKRQHHPEVPAGLRVKIYKMALEPRQVTHTRSWLAGRDDLQN